MWNRVASEKMFLARSCLNIGSAALLFLMSLLMLDGMEMTSEKSRGDGHLVSASGAVQIGAANCVWESYSPDPRVYVTQPGNVKPHRIIYNAGQYFLFVGAAGTNGLNLPPKILKTYGPLTLKGGCKYMVIMHSVHGDEPNVGDRAGLPNLILEENSYITDTYPSPGTGRASLFVRNQVLGNMWYAICLLPAGGGGGAVILGDWLILDDVSPSEKSRWTVTETMITQSSNIYRTDQEKDIWWQGTKLINDQVVSDIVLSADITPTDNDGVGLIIRYRDDKNYYRFIMCEDRGNGGPFRRLERFMDGVRLTLAEKKEGFVPNQKYRIVIQQLGTRLSVSVNGTIILTADDGAHPSGGFGLMTYACSARFENITVKPR